MTRQLNAEIHVSAALLRMILDLPPSYRIVGAETSECPGTIALLVEAEQLTAVAQGEPLHLLKPIMQRVDGGQATLLRVDVMLSEDRARPPAPSIGVKVRE